MRTDDLRRSLERLDGRPYPAYRDLRGQRFEVGPLSLRLVHVQGDPFAAPSRLELRAAPGVAALPRPAVAGADARRATADFVHRAVARALGGFDGGEGSGSSGRVAIAAVGQEVLERTGCTVEADGAVRWVLSVGLPAAGRRILGRAAAALLGDAVPRAVAGALEGLDRTALRRHVEAVLDQVALRAALADAGLVAFLADGAVLPRRSGVDERPLGEAVPLVAPDALAVTLTAPFAGPLRGLGVPVGVTLIVGGGYHGKSTLLDALARGVYDHVPGDGRERCVTRGEAVAIRAEDGRAMEAVDLRPFIGALPGGRETRRFSTADASGSTSQAAAIVEAVEAGASALLVDEDTAATNFMIRDARMRRLIPAGGEPITPFLDRVRQLHGELGVSSVLVVGGAGDYLDVADRVIRMHDYRPHDATAAARAVAAALPLGEAAPRAPGPWPVAAARAPLGASFDARRGRRERVRSVATRVIEFGEEEIDVSAVAQLVDPAQARAIGDALLALGRGLADGRRSMAWLLDRLDEVVAREGLVALCGEAAGDRARPRRFEVAAAINRLRSLRVAG